MSRFLIFISLLMPFVASASSYPDPWEGFFAFMGLSFVASLIVYVVLGVILLLFGKFYVAYMVPVFLVLMTAGMMTVFETVLMQLAGLYPGGIIIGALISTGIYIYLVKYNMRINKEELNNTPFEEDLKKISEEEIINP